MDYSFYCCFAERCRLCLGLWITTFCMFGYWVFHTVTRKGSACDFLSALLTASDEYPVCFSWVMSPVSLSLFPKPFFIRNLNCRRIYLGSKAFPVSLEISRIVLRLYLCRVTLQSFLPVICRSWTHCFHCTWKFAAARREWPFGMIDKRRMVMQPLISDNTSSSLDPALLMKWATQVPACFHETGKVTTPATKVVGLLLNGMCDWVQIFSQSLHVGALLSLLQIMCIFCNQ